MKAEYLSCHASLPKEVHCVAGNGPCNCLQRPSQRVASGVVRCKPPKYMLSRGTKALASRVAGGTHQVHSGADHTVHQQVAHQAGVVVHYSAAGAQNQMRIQASIPVAQQPGQRAVIA